MIFSLTLPTEIWYNYVVRLREVLDRLINILDYGVSLEYIS